MEKGQVFRVNTPQVVCETVDGEVAIVNLEKGYYSLFKTGVEVWSRIARRLVTRKIYAHRGTARSDTGSESANQIVHGKNRIN